MSLAFWFLRHPDRSTFFIRSENTKWGYVSLNILFSSYVYDFPSHLMTSPSKCHSWPRFRENKSAFGWRPRTRCYRTFALKIYGLFRRMMMTMWRDNPKGENKMKILRANTQMAFPVKLDPDYIQWSPNDHNRSASRGDSYFVKEIWISLFDTCTPAPHDKYWIVRLMDWRSRSKFLQRQSAPDWLTEVFRCVNCLSGTLYTWIFVCLRCTRVREFPRKDINFHALTDVLRQRGALQPVFVRIREHWWLIKHVRILIQLPCIEQFFWEQMPSH